MNSKWNYRQQQQQRPSGCLKFLNFFYNSFDYDTATASTTTTAVSVVNIFWFIQLVAGWYFLYRGCLAIRTRVHSWPLLFFRTAIEYSFKDHSRFWLYVHILSSSLFYVMIVLQTFFFLPKMKLSTMTTTTTLSSSNPPYHVPRFDSFSKRFVHRILGRICLGASSFGCLSSLVSLSWRAPYGTSWAYVTWGLVWFIATIQTYRKARQHCWFEHQCWADFLKKTAGLFVLARILIICLYLLPLSTSTSTIEHQLWHHAWAYRWGVYTSGTWVHGLFWKTLLHDKNSKSLHKLWNASRIRYHLLHGLKSMKKEWLHYYYIRFEDWLHLRQTIDEQTGSYTQ